MITDKIENINNYSDIPAKVAEFLQTLTADTPVGHYVIDDKAYVNVDTYETKPVENCKFEAHKKYIDIQMLLSGEEELDYMSINDLQVSEQYDEARDVMFFADSQKTCDTLYLEPYKFAVIYPHEAHRPQMNGSTVSQSVKKVVAKILV